MCKAEGTTWNHPKGDIIIVIDNRSRIIRIPKVVRVQIIPPRAQDVQYDTVGLGVYPDVFEYCFDPIFSCYPPDSPL